MENRELKFRVWNGTKMEYNVMAGFLGAFYVQGIDEKDSASMSPFNTKYFPETPVMQYTGVKDKNGKEIFQGDYFQVAKNKTYEIRYMESGESNYEWYGGMFVLWLNEETFFPFDEYAMKHGEIIGNIYEHPRLLIPSNT